MKLVRMLSLAFALLVPVTVIASPTVAKKVSCCPGDCCDHCPMCPRH
jgi:hypothetical protein